MKHITLLKELVFNGILTESALAGLEGKGITVRKSTPRRATLPIDEADFSPLILNQATKMASVYVAFFSLENAVREFIEDRLLERKGVNWWDEHVPEKIQKSTASLKEKEQKNRYHASRSSSDIGYTLFGSLAQIIISNWEDFSEFFPDQHWLSSRFNDLELSRNIIMHSGMLPDSEISRIQSISRDWVNQVG